MIGNREDASVALATPTNPTAIGTDTSLTYLDHALWQQLQEASSREAFAKCWLILQCTQIAGASRGVIVLGAPDSGNYAPVAFWPEGKGGNLGLTTAAELALQERRGVLRTNHQEIQLVKDSKPDSCHIAYPLLIDGQLHGVVAVELTYRPEVGLHAAMRQLQWGRHGWKFACRGRESDNFPRKTSVWRRFLNGWRPASRANDSKTLPPHWSQTWPPT